MGERVVHVGILRAPGTNCNQETAQAFEAVGALVEQRLVQDIIEGDQLLRRSQILALPGGFSHGDDVRSGIIAGLKLQTYLGDQFNDFISRGGLVIGICNGFQELVSTGLLPGGKLDGNIQAALAHNQSGHFQSGWTDLKVETNSRCVFLNEMPESINYYIAHGEGRFIADRNTLSVIEAGGLVTFRYRGLNPNGSMNSIAGITDPTGRILGLMPHPEKFFKLTQHPNWRRSDGPKKPQGLPLFEGMVRYVMQS